MKTTAKKMYVAPAVEVVEIELEEGIAQTSGGAAAPAPGIDDWGDGGSSSGNGEAF